MPTKLPTVTAPTIHHNGTSKRDLLEGYVNADAAIRKAMEAMAKTCPNGRDYYPQGPHAMGQAQREHEARMEALRDIAKQMVALAEAVEDA